MTLGQAYKLNPYFLGITIKHGFFGQFSAHKVHWETLSPRKTIHAPRTLDQEQD